MAREGLFALACAAVVAASQIPAGYAADNPRTPDVSAVLRVQTAIQRGRELLLQGQARAAIDLLETELAFANGSQAYLTLLRDAYRAYIRDLQLANQDASAKVYLHRLSILEPGPRLGHDNPSHSTPTAAVSLPKPSAVRANIDIKDETPRVVSPRPSSRASELIARAQQEFEKTNYAEAARLFAQANEVNPQSTEQSRQRWAYCKLHHVVAQLNDHSSAYQALEAEVRAALTLAPGLKYGEQLLDEIAKRRRDETASADDGAAPSIRDLGTNADGWHVIETANFRIFHTQSQQFAEEAARVAEHTRATMLKRWFAATGETWNPKCDLFLHANAQDYHRMTHAPESSPGHSSFNFDRDSHRLTGRRIDVRCDNPTVLTAVLPHETTHTVLAGGFDAPVPRWADEGMAVLSEPRDKIDRHLQQLPRFRQDRVLFSMSQLLQMNDYPSPQYVGSFYAQGVSVVDYLSSLKGHRVFADFLREGMHHGYEPALQKYYGISGFADLEQRWAEHVFPDLVGHRLAQGNR